MSNITSLLKELARAELDLLSEDFLKQKQQAERAMQAIREREAKPDEIKRQIREAVQDHMAVTGKIEAPEPAKPYVTIRKMARIHYDPDEALAYVVSIGRGDDFTRTTLNKAAFNKALKGELKDWTGAEQVFDLNIAVNKTGDLLITEENE